MVVWKSEITIHAFHTVLIVSRDAEMISVWETLFTQKDCAVVSEACEYDAVQTARLLAPSLIILDLDLPHTERIDLCSKLRSTTNGTLLLLAPRGDDQQLFEYYRAGVDERLSTPISPLVLLIKSMSWLMRPQWTGVTQNTTSQISA